MPRKDAYHDIVVKAMEKDGWVITHDPYRLAFGNVELLADLGAERLLAAERETEKEARTLARLLLPATSHRGS